MVFDKEAYTVEECALFGQTIRFRAWRGLSYVEKPVVPEYQRLNLFAPEALFAGKSVNGYTLSTAPVFVPNTVGGYMPGAADEPKEDRHHPGQANAVFQALRRGYVVAAPAIRGRSQAGGQAPACIVDYKAAVRWLHYFSDCLPGDESKIITNGTSAGGALSALIGAAGDHPDYAPYLREIGAADASDAVFAASCYCPITNLEHADMAYEWEFAGIYDYHRKHMRKDEGGRPSFEAIDGELTELQRKTSRDLAAAFPAYVNSLGLKDASGAPLTLDAEGKGSFKAFLESVVLDSARRAEENGIDVSGKAWLTMKAGRPEAMDFAGYVRDITRMKTAPAFDDLTLASPENNLFGTPEQSHRHFTAYSAAHSLQDGSIAPAQLIKLLNPMYYVEDSVAVKAPHWRIRHGECDRDTSLAISAILTLKLREHGCPVDYHSPWDTPHSGDYDLEELFTWIDGICR